MRIDLADNYRNNFRSSMVKHPLATHLFDSKINKLPFPPTTQQNLINDFEITQVLEVYLLRL